LAFILFFVVACTWYEKNWSAENLTTKREYTNTFTGGLYFQIAEVSYSSVLKTDSIVSQPNKTGPKFMASALMKIKKSAACVQLITAGHGPYKIKQPHLSATI
jgi:hypothetical protein